MALTDSHMLELGTEAPYFKLLNTVDDLEYSLNELKGTSATLVMFICNHCPYVIHVNDEMVRIANDYKSSGLNCVAISANDIVHYPQDAPDKMKICAKELNYPFPYLFDETQEVARSYDAACTPDFYLFDASLSLVYRGRLDASRPANNIPLTGKDLREAIQHVLDGQEIIEPQFPSAGCNIKWKK
ncbi:MAG: thioredoxin family protein [Bacteroidota bacterium]|nr:thioredoxin family protein [Bacteroidota bacterium]